MRSVTLLRRERAELLPKLLISFQPKVVAGDCKLENSEIGTEGISRGGFTHSKLKPGEMFIFPEFYFWTDSLWKLLSHGLRKEFADKKPTTNPHIKF
ncbi:hypothetical protein scyTo_0021932 [Scyliorhinus torazame]|uniref:Uncharacterized protein n=1 Tax=Scyliorhinus torazame TaxID=75743 RepID=A0A401Q9H7_SCYTO|nr:hypothetical protein [Scyliorhinus torazame]